jgi:ubiquinone/menaquinone biosynthesis C-methylase UbiE
MLARVLETEVMDTAEEAVDYNTMDHSVVNRVFAEDFFASGPTPDTPILDVGTGTALIPIEFCRQQSSCKFVAVDLATEMLKVAAKNVSDNGLSARITLEQVDGKRLPYGDGSFAAVVSNSIIHHIPEPRSCFAEMHRVCAVGGRLFVRDLRRPQTEEELVRLVNLYAEGANDHQRQLFADSLRAALTLAEVREMVAELGYDQSSVIDSTDRHWTWSATKTPGTH